MATSQNSWRVRDRGELVWFTACGQRFAAANQDVAVIGQYLIERFDREVESIKGKVLDDWSWAVRPVRGQTTGFSNHASATAWDLNALQHPRGVRGTFTAAQKTRIQRILDDITDDSDDRVLRAGEWFSSTVDGMHFEINAGERSTKQAADKIRRLAKVEDEVTKEDLAKVKAMIAEATPSAREVALEVVRMLGGPTVANTPLGKDDKPTNPWPNFGAILAAGDRKADLSLRNEADILAMIQQVLAAVVPPKK